MSAKKKLVRAKFRDEVFKRDSYKCQACLHIEQIDEVLPEDQLDAHHITDRNEMPNGGYVKENGISLCARHHELAEIYHTSGHQEWPHMYHPEDLYAIIGSSYEQAVIASEKLK